MGPIKTKSRRSFWRAAGVVGGLLAVAAVLLGLKLRRELPRELLPDVRAGMAARNIKDPDQRLKRYLELRYGSLDDPAVRERVFLDFFNTDRIKALQLLVRHSPPSQRQASINAMSRWIEGYERALTPEERVALRQRFSTDEGRAMLQRATAQYNSQGVEYRGQTAIVISQLLRTISSVQQP